MRIIFLILMLWTYSISSNAESEDLMRIMHGHSSYIKKISGDKFAGMWVPREGARPILALTSPIEGDEEILKSFDIRYVKYSVKDLQFLNDRAVRNLRINYSDIYSAKIDYESNSIVVKIRKEDFEKFESIFAKRGIDMDAIRFEQPERQGDTVNLLPLFDDGRVIK